MSDVYVECLVKQKNSVARKLLVVFLAVLALFVFILMLFNPIFFIVFMVFLIAVYFANMHANVEYEYLYIDRELIVDKVLAKSRRKRAATFYLEHIEILAPIHSHRLDGFRHREVKEVDYSVGEALTPDERYVMYCDGQRILLNPSPEMVKAMKTLAPRKIFMD